MEVLTAAQMYAAERAAMDAGHATGAALMERAGNGLVTETIAHWPALASASHRAVVLCGPGNNGGDGFVGARLLQERGWLVRVYAKGWDTLGQADAERDDAPPDARANAQRWQALGGEILPLDSDFSQALCTPGHVVVIDALLGLGQNRDTTAMLAPWWAACTSRQAAAPRNALHCVSVDVPTGYDTDSGTCLCDRPFPADLTVTFHRPKPVHAVLQARGHAIAVCDIGL